MANNLSISEHAENKLQPGVRWQFSREPSTRSLSICLENSNIKKYKTDLLTIISFLVGVVFNMAQFREGAKQISWEKLDGETYRTFFSGNKF